MKQIPFVANISIEEASGRRFEKIRRLQKVAVLAYSAISEDSDITLALPGGGNNTGQYATSVKPKIGLNPAQLTVVGFLSTTDKILQEPSEYYSVLQTKLTNAMNGIAPEYEVNFEVFRIEVMNKIFGVRKIIDKTDFQTY
jgi:hypothetical protein